MCYSNLSLPPPFRNTAVRHFTFELIFVLSFDMSMTFTNSFNFEQENVRGTGVTTKILKHSRYKLGYLTALQLFQVFYVPGRCLSTSREKNLFHERIRFINRILTICIRLYPLLLSRWIYDLGSDCFYHKQFHFMFMYQRPD